MNYHPLRVFHPGKGIHYVCRWWTHNEQHQIIVAKNEHTLARIWKLACEKYTDAEAKDLCEVELIGPSNLMCSKAVSYEREANIKSFMNDVCGSVAEAIRLELPIPPQFTNCPGFVMDNDDREPDSSDLKYHFDCRNCNHRVALVGFTPEQFYDKFSAAWMKVNPSPARTDRYSSASPALDDEIIWEASCDFGHHRAGVELNQCEVGEPPWHNAHPWGFFHLVLFYFRMRRKMDITPYNLIAIQYRGEQAKLDEAKRHLIKVKRRMDEIQIAEKKLAIFQ